MSILVLQSSWWRRESWLLCLICLPGVSWWLSGSSSQCHGVVCSFWLWYFLIVLTYYSCVLQLLKHVIKYCEKVYERSRKKLFWFIKIQVKFWINLKLEISMRPVCLIMIFLLFTLLYHMVWLKINVLILLKEPSIGKALLTLHVTTETHFLLQKNLKNSMRGLVKMYVTRWPFCCTTFLFDLAPSCIDK